MTIYKVEEVLETLDNVYREVGRQQALWGVQTHPDGTSSEEYKELADNQKVIVEEKTKDGTLTYADIFLEEVYEALACDNPGDLIEELEQTCAVAVSWIRTIKDR